MKLQSIIVLLLAILVSCNGNKPPKAVTTTFEEMYPTTSNILWEITDDKIYHVSFEFQDHKWVAEFDANGNWIMSTEDLENDKLPWNIEAYLDVFYPDELIYCKYIELTESKLYKVSFDDATEDELVFDIEGIIIKDEKNPIYQKFTDKYKNATNVDWKKLENGNFMASFSQNESEWNSTFLADGNWVCSNTNITLSNMPSDVCDYLAKIKNFEPKEFKEKSNAEGIKYMVDGEIKETCVSFVFDSDGKFLEKINLDYK